MTPLRLHAAARIALLLVAVGLLAERAPGGLGSIALPATGAVLLILASAALAALRPAFWSPAIGAALPAVDAAWFAGACAWAGAPAAADGWFAGPAALAGAAGGWPAGAIVGALCAAAQAWSALAAGAGVAGCAARAALPAIVAAALALAVDTDRRGKLARLKAALGSQHRLQVSELFQHTLFQVREYLTSVTSVAEALTLQAQGSPLADKLGRLRLLVQECNGKIGRLMDTMRARATARRQAPTPFPVRDLLREVAASAAELHGGGPVQAVVRCEPTLELKLDRELVRELVLSLAQNAAEALGAAGGKILLSGQLGEKSVDIEVSDPGGVPDEILGEVFQPLFTTKEGQGGLGLGLSMARRIARALGGNLELLTDGATTTARLSLPPEGGLPQVFTGDSTWAGRRAAAGK